MADAKGAILDAALELFAERGFDETTMRSIATQAGVSPSHAYYYFRSKDALLQEFYQRVQIRHAQASDDALSAGGDLSSRLAAVAHTGLDLMAPYHRFGANFAGSALRFDNPANPFSADSTAAREQALALFRRVVDGAVPAVPARIRPVLPELLWLGYLGVVLFWASDSSPDQQRARDLIDSAVPLAVGLVRLARLPLTGGVVGQLTGLVRVILPN